MTSDRIPQAPPPIPAINESAQRPLWSVMIPTFNCSNYLKDTLLSVLATNIAEGEMQIEVIDDCSTDADVQSLVEQNGEGRVSFFRQENNVGSLRNFETCINRA